MTTKNILYTLIFSILCSVSFAQTGKLKKADSFFYKLSYAYAAEIYTDLLGSKVDSPELKSKLAQCFYQMGDMKNAELYFSQMIDTKEATKEDYFLYAQSLKQNAKYRESDLWMKRFHTSTQTDLRGQSYMNNPSYIAEIEKQGEHFTIKNLIVNTLSSDFGAYPSPVNSDVYFVSSRNSQVAVQNEWSWNSREFLDLYKAQALSDLELTNEVRISKKTNTRFHEGPLCFAPDGKTVYFTRNNVSNGIAVRDEEGIQNLKLYKATVTQDGQWVEEVELPFNSRDYSVGHPSISADGKTLYFASDMPGGFGGADIYKVAMNADGSFGSLQNMGKSVNTEGQEMFPWISTEGNLFFSSNGHIGLGGLDIFVLLAAKNGDFGKLINVGIPVNGQNDDFAFSMNKDARTGYFASNRTGGKGDDDIFSYVLIKPFMRQLIVDGIVKDETTGQILSGAPVQLIDANGTVIGTTFSDKQGQYIFDLEPEMKYTIRVANVPDYFDNSIAVSTMQLEPTTESVNGDVFLEKDPGLSLYCLVSDKSSGLQLNGVTVKITDSASEKSILTATTQESGDVRSGLKENKIGDKLSYTIVLSKEGYLEKTINFAYTITSPGQINIHELLDIAMTKLDVGQDLATMIEIKPILFDLNKFNIRKDAALELEKIIKVMNQYPTMVIELGSHTDCRGSIASNTTLSDKRAKASAEYIKARITNPERIYGKGYGESKLKVDCPCEGTVKSTCSEDEHQKNRRTEFIIIKM
jgi:outer membrane protein OmpA-like peptidoglycan-associated protein